MIFKVSIAQLVTPTIDPLVESEPQAITPTVGSASWGKSISDVAQLTDVLTLFRDEFTVDAESDEHAMHEAHADLDQRIRAASTNGQSYALSAYQADCCQPVKDTNGNIVGHLSFCLVISTESVPQEASGEDQPSYIIEETLAFSASDGGFAFASVLIGIVPADGEPIVPHAVAAHASI